MIVHVDGHADINTVLHECGLDRFHGAKVIYSLYSSGLVTVSDAVIDAIGQGLSVAVRGPIDLYNEVFLTTLTDSNVTKQLRVEIIDDKEVEIPIVAGMVPLATGAGKAASDEHAAGGDSEALVFTASASSPEQAWKRLGGDSSAFVILANANDVDSLRVDASRPRVRARPRRRAHRRRHLRVHGRRPGQPSTRSRRRSGSTARRPSSRASSATATRCSPSSPRRSSSSPPEASPAGDRRRPPLSPRRGAGRRRDLSI